jgi:hypothetical protein
VLQETKTHVCLCYCKSPQCADTSLRQGAVKRVKFTHV